MKIEDGIAIPPRRANAKYPFRKMEVGQSFRVEVANIDKVRNAVGAANRTTGMKFTVRAYKDAYRCWRIA